MNQFLYFTLVGLGIGAIYGLVSLSIVLLFNGSGLFNFAQGDFVMIGAITAVVTLKSGLPYPVAIGLSVLLPVAISGVVGVMTYIPLKKGGYDIDVILLGTIGISIVLENGAALWAGAAYSLPSVTGGANLKMGALKLPIDYLVLMAAAVALFAIVRYVYSTTDLGLTLRAVSMDFEAAAATGVRTASALMLTWIFAGVVGGVGGVLIGTVTLVNAYMGLTLTINGLAGAVVGGLYSPFGALVGGVILGVGEAYAGAYGSSAVQQLIGPALILMVLLLRPTGLSKPSAVERRV